MNQEPAQILKVDVSGRVWTPRERREAVLDELERSGMAATKFAEHVGVKYPTLASWVQKRRRRRAAVQGAGTGGGDRGPAACQWVEAAVDAAAGGGERRLTVHLPGGARVEVADAWQVDKRSSQCHAISSDGGG